MITDDQGTTEIMREAAARATLAPSIHNTQPWRFRLGRHSLEMRLDPERQLHVLDPGRRQLLISCGCALFNARVAVAAGRHTLRVERFPEPSDPDLVARLTLGEPNAPWTPLVRLDAAIDLRRSNRREFFDTRVSEEVLWELTTAASAEDATVVPVSGLDQRRDVAALVREADAIENADPDYLAELRKWTIERSTPDDGVAAGSYPQATGRHGEIPLRDFGSGLSGHMPPVLDSGLDQCLLVIGTRADDPLHWLRAGEALERLWLEATRLDQVVSLLSQPVEVRQTRQRLGQVLGADIWPQALLRVGQAAPNVATRRRPLDQVLDEPVTQPPTH
jgi:hypothetical protein